jgi:hypothetical protein
VLSQRKVTVLRTQCITQGSCCLRCVCMRPTTNPMRLRTAQMSRGWVKRPIQQCRALAINKPRRRGGVPVKLQRYSPPLGSRFVVGPCALDAASHCTRDIPVQAITQCSCGRTRAACLCNICIVLKTM